MQQAPALEIADCGGACLPAPAASPIDLYYTRAILELRPVALAVLERASGVSTGWLRSMFADLHEMIARLPAHDFVAAFKPSVAFFNLHPAIVQRDPLAAALSLVRFVIGGPNLRATRVVIPVEAMPATGLYLPHLDLVLSGDCGPVAAQGVDEHVRFTWTDGVSIDVPEPSTETVPDGEDRFFMLPRVQDWPILNPVAEANDPRLAILPPPTMSLSGLELHTLSAGLDLLSDVWPLAYATTRRFLHSAILQTSPADHTTSTTLDFLQGTFIASCRDAVQIADALVHEGSHARLALLLRADPLILDDGAARFESPWRTDLRPLKGILNGVHAFLNVALFYRKLAERRPELADDATQLFETQRGNVKAAWTACAEHAVPTPLGQRFLDELGREVERL